MTEPDIETPLDHAARYAALDLRVIPIKPGGKYPAGFARWQDEATTDAATVREWWGSGGRFAGYGVGLAMGPQPDGRNLFAVDLDEHNPSASGSESLAMLEDTYGKLPETVRAITGSNGVHLIFEAPAGVDLRNSAGNIAPGVDIRGDGGQIVAAPSIHPDTGRAYEWEHGYAPWEHAIAPAPAWLVELAVPTVDDTPSKPRPAPGIVLDPDNPADIIRARWNWAAELAADGWQLHHTDRTTGDTHWTRPGKATRDGSSGVLHEPDGPFVIFSTDAELGAHRRVGRPTPAGGVALSPLAFYAARQHGGDLSAAGRQIRADTRPQGSTTRPGIAVDGPQQPSAPIDAPWPDPSPLGDSRDRPAFPVDALPYWIAAHARQVAEEFQFPPDLPAMLAIGALSIICARKAEVVVQGTWREPLNTYTATAMPPSSAKSPAFRAMLGVLERYEKQLIEDTAPELDRIETERAMLEQEKAKAVKSGARAEALAAGDKLRDLPERVSPRLMADDATPEVLTRMLADQGGRLALVSTEGGIFGLMSGRYSEKTNLNVYLQAWSGDAIRVDRIGRPSTVVLNAALTLAVTVQPSVIAALSETPELAGRGLTARIMYAFPTSTVGFRDMAKPPSIDETVADTYERNLLELARRMEGGDRDRSIRFDPDAHQAYVEWRQEMEVRCRPGAELDQMAEWVTKLGSTVARLAGLFTLAEAGTMVDGDTMTRAIEVGRYWEQHARHAYESLWTVGSPAIGRAAQILDWAAVNELDRFQVRDLYRAKRNWTAVDAMDACQVLVDNGFARVVDDAPLTPRPGKASPTVVLHPDFTHFRTQPVPVSHLSPKQPKNSITYLLSFPRESEGEMDGQGQDGQVGQVEAGPVLEWSPFS
jgi:replicative DNA helicase